MISKPESNEYDPFYAGYVGLVIEKDILAFLASQGEDMINFFNALPLDKIEYAYSEGKWTIKQLLRHMIDAERVFAYRIMTLGRCDSTSLPGFHEEDYMLNADDSNNSYDILIEEFELLRKANLIMVSNLPKSVHTFVGRVNNAVTSTRALIFIMAGHAAHHMNILQERYL